MKEALLDVWNMFLGAAVGWIVAYTVAFIVFFIKGDDK